MIRHKKTRPKDKSVSAADQAYSGIMDLVLCHGLRPGERTSVNLLSAKLGLGRTPVKEAITRLQTEGLLSVAGRSGTVVNQIDRERTEHLFALRQVLEGFAAEEAARKVTSDQLQKIRDLLQEMKVYSSAQANIQAAASFVRANVAFHSLIVAAVGNPILDRFYAKLQMQFQIVTYLVQRGYNPQAAERRQKEHEAIAKALAARDGKMLKQALKSHAQATEATILETLESALPRPAARGQARRRKSA